MSVSFGGFLSALTKFKVRQFGSSANGIPAEGQVLDEEAETPVANVAGSLRKPRFEGAPRLHAVAIDIDIPAWLIQSSTAGHNHLYADVLATEEDYFAWLRASAKIGLIEDGYAEASIRRGHSDLRLPWIRKGFENPVEPSMPPEPGPAPF